LYACSFLGCGFVRCIFKLKQFVEETYGFWKRKSKNQNGSV
jgi:hypothetical protein